MPSLRQTILPGILSVSLTILAPIVRAQSPANQTTSVNELAIVRLENTTHPLAIEANAVGRVEASREFLRMLLVLSNNGQEEELKRLLDEQQNRTSANYHHWLTAAEFGQRFGAADADVQMVRAWLESAGFTVERVAASKRWVEFSGTSAQVENAFHTVMQYYRVSGKTYLANSTDVGIPVELSGIARGIVSLNSFGKRPPIRQAHGLAGRNSQGRRIRLTPNLTAAGATNTYYLAPGDFAAIYNTNALLNAGIDGSGVAIAVTAQSDIELTDVQQFRQIFGLKVNDPNILVSGPDPGIASETDSEEALLDVEWAGAVAPGATINLVVAGSTDATSGVDLAATYAIDNEVAPILTYTYGGCEQTLGPTGNAFYNALWQQAAAEGITVLVASGDSGAAGCDSASAGVPATQGLAVNGAASTPYNVAVGGTEFADGADPATYWNAANSTDYASAIGYIPEAAWNESCDPGQPLSATNCVYGTGNFSLLAGGGGASAVYQPKPAWQTGLGVPADNARDLPDVALAAASGHDEAVYCTSLQGVPCQINGQNEVVGLTLVGGTSASTPAMAGILALVEQKNGAFQGQVNYVLYQLAQMQGNSCNSSNQTTPTAHNSCVFYDVTSGSNAVPCAGNTAGCSSTQSGTNGLLTGNLAGPGYDLATGLGSVNATNLAAAWNSATRVKSQATLQASSTTFAHGTAIALGGTVAPTFGNGSPTGAVSIKTDLFGDSSQVLNLSGGVFSGNVSDLPGGQYNLYAYYAGDATYAASSSGVVPLTVSPENSATTLTPNGVLNGGTIAYGTSLILTAKTVGASGQGVVTGTVTVQDKMSVVGTYNLGADGSASITTGGGSAYSFAPGTHSLTAMYSGDNSFIGSTSQTVAFTVGKGTPFVVVGANQSTLAFGETLGVHAVVSGQGTAPATGTIQFTVDGNPTGSPIALQTGGFFGTQAQASLLISNLNLPGPHTIGASYNGSADPNYLSVSSGDAKNESTWPVLVNANAGNTTTTSLIVNSAQVINLGDTVNLTVAVSPANATGTVTLWDAVGPRSAATTITGGSVTISFPWTQAGNAMVYAVYSGDVTNAASASAPKSFTVLKGSPQVSLVAPASASPNQQVSLNTSVSGNPGNSLLPYPTGAVEFWDSLNGGPAQLLTVQNLTAGAGGISVYATRAKFAAGVHSLHVHYRGDTNWQATDSAPVLLASSTFSVSVTPVVMAADSQGSGTVTITPSGGFVGTVALTCGTGGTFVPAGYACGFQQANVPVNGAQVTTTLYLTPSATAAAAVQNAGAQGNSSALWGMGLAGGLLLGFVASGAGGAKNSRNFLVACGLLICVVCMVGACGGGGGGGGGGPVSTNTTISSTNLKVAYGTGVTFTVTVTPNGSATPTGAVQLYDNGQAYGSPANVSAGIATFLSTSLPVGVHNLSAAYRGDANTLPSTSGSIAQAITGQVDLQISGASNGLTETADFAVTVN